MDSARFVSTALSLLVLGAAAAYLFFSFVQFAIISIRSNLNFDMMSMRSARYPGGHFPRQRPEVKVFNFPLEGWGDNLTSLHNAFQNLWSDTFDESVDVNLDDLRKRFLSSSVSHPQTKDLGIPSGSQEKLNFGEVLSTVSNPLSSSVSHPPRKDPGILSQEEFNFDEVLSTLPERGGDLIIRSGEAGSPPQILSVDNIDEGKIGIWGSTTISKGESMAGVEHTTEGIELISQHFDLILVQCRV